MTTKDQLRDELSREAGLLAQEILAVSDLASVAANAARDALTAAVDARDRVAALTDQLVDTEGRLLALVDGLPDPGAEPDPEPEPGYRVLVRGPVIPAGGIAPNRGEFHHLFTKGFARDPWKAWHSKAGYGLNAGEWQGTPGGGLAVRMDPAHGDPSTRAGSSESHEGWLYFDERYRQVKMELDLELVEPWEWPLTAKAFGGLVGWNGAWPEWPGGGRYGADNASVRLIANDWGHQGRARLGAYLYLGRPFVQSEVRGPSANYVSNAGRSVEYLLHAYGVPEPGRTIHAAIEAWAGDDGRGGLHVALDGADVLHLENLPWFGQGGPIGWNTGYVCGIYGGDAPEFNPAGGSRTMAYRNLVYSTPGS